MSEPEKKTPEERFKERLAALGGGDVSKQDELGRTIYDQRIDFLMELMDTGRWLPGVTERVIATGWNCSRPHVRRMAAEASRAIKRRLHEDPKALADARAACIFTFMRLAYKAEQLGDAQGLREARESTLEYARFMGIAPKPQLELSDADPFAGWSTEDKERFASTGERPSRKVRRVLAAAIAEGVAGPNDE